MGAVGAAGIVPRFAGSCSGSVSHQPPPEAVSYTLRKMRGILRLTWGMGLGNRHIARSLQVLPGTMSDTLRRAREAG